MNELHSIAPNACETGRELEYVLKSFGPHAGRYVIGLPQRNGWCMSVLENHSGLRDVERQRLSRALELARTRGSVIDYGQFAWTKERSWIENVKKLWNSKSNYRKVYISDQDFDAIRERSPSIEGYFAKITEIETSSANNLSATCDVETYWSLMEVLCSVSTELHVVDPYFDPLKRDRQPIFEKILKELSRKPHIKRIIFWARHAEVVKGYSHNGSAVNRDRLISVLRSCFQRNTKHAAVVLRFVEDEVSVDKFHARFLVTNKGGILFDQGFQVLSNGRRNIISAMSPSVQDEQFAKLSRGSIDMHVREEVVFMPTL